MFFLFVITVIVFKILINRYHFFSTATLWYLQNFVKIKKKQTVTYQLWAIIKNVWKLNTYKMLCCNKQIVLSFLAGRQSLFILLKLGFLAVRIVGAGSTQHPCLFYRQSRLRHRWQPTLDQLCCLDCVLFQPSQQLHFLMDRNTLNNYFSVLTLNKNWRQ